jgi:hypothetical protein
VLATVVFPKSPQRLLNVAAHEASVAPELERRQQSPAGVVLDGRALQAQVRRDLAGGHQLGEQSGGRVVCSRWFEAHGLLDGHPGG